MDGAAHQLDELTRDREPQAGALLLRRLAYLDEGIEDACPVFVRDPGPGVLHAKLQKELSRTIGVPGMQPQRDRILFPCT